MFLVFAIFFLVFGGCAARSSLSPSEAVLVPRQETTESLAWRQALGREEGSRELEPQRIEYLLERVRKSPYNFIRNGSRYTGKRAEAHLRWKYFHNLQKVKTAEDFIRLVATRSKKSGMTYTVELPGDRRFPLHRSFLEELRRFDEALKTRQSIESQTSD